MKHLFLLLFMIVGIISINAKPKKSKQFEIMLPSKFALVDASTNFGKIREATTGVNNFVFTREFLSKVENYSEADIKLLIRELEFKHKILVYTLIENDVILDTIVTVEYKLEPIPNFNGMRYQKHKLKPEQSYSEYCAKYLADNVEYNRAKRNKEQMTESYLKSINEGKQIVADQQRRKREQDMANKMAELRIERERNAKKHREAREECERIERVQQYILNRIAGTNLNAKHGELRTETGTNPYGAKITYTYYIDDNGNKVKHGIFKASRTYNNEYRNNINDDTYSDYIGMWLTGSESITYNYQHGVTNGTVTLNVDVSIQSNQLGTRKIVKNESITVYNGMIDGNFNYKYKGKKFSGKANKGILEWLEVDGNTVKKYTFPKKENTILQDHSINSGLYESYLSLEGISLSSEQIDLPYIYEKNPYPKRFGVDIIEDPCEFLRAEENRKIEMMEAQGEDPDLIPVE